MQLDVYQTDAEAFDATAERAAAALRATAGSAPLAVGVSGGRGGRGVLAALAGRTDVPWDRVVWYWVDERCVPDTDPRSNVRLARETLLGPRGIRADRIHPPPTALGDPARIAAAYAETVAGVTAFDVLLLGVGKDGHVASLMPGCRALRAEAPVAAVDADEVSEDPRVARVTLTPPVLTAARCVLVTVTTDAKAEIVRRVLRDPLEPERLPAQLVRPGPGVEWLVDRAAAAALLRDATPAEAAR